MRRRARAVLVAGALLLAAAPVGLTQESAPSPAQTSLSSTSAAAELGPATTRSVRRAPVGRSKAPEHYRPTRVLENGEPLRWNPCEPVRYRVNTASAHPGFASYVAAVVAAAARATGMTFRPAGSTRFVPFSGARTPTDAELFFAVAGERQVPGLAGQVIGLGGFESRVSSDGTAGVITKGHVLLDAALPDPARTRRIVLLHEVGHALGLGHVENPYAIMNPRLTGFLRPRFEESDRMGLQRLGLTYGCVDLEP